MDRHNGGLAAERNGPAAFAPDGYGSAEHRARGGCAHQHGDAGLDRGPLQIEPEGPVEQRGMAGPASVGGLGRRPLTAAQYEQLERIVPYAPYFGAGFQIVALPLAAAVIAAIALAVFNALLGGDGTFKQAFAIVAHSGVVLSVAQLFGLPLAYARQTLSSATNLGVFAPFLDESSFAARLLGAIDLFIVWWMISLAIGLAVLYRKRTGPIAATLLVLYVAIGIVIAAVKTAMSGA